MVELATLARFLNRRIGRSLRKHRRRVQARKGGTGEKDSSNAANGSGNHSDRSSSSSDSSPYSSGEGSARANTQDSTNSKADGGKRDRGGWLSGDEEEEKALEGATPSWLAEACGGGPKQRATRSAALLKTAANQFEDPTALLTLAGQCLRRAKRNRQRWVLQRKKMKKQNRRKSTERKDIESSDANDSSSSGSSSGTQGGSSAPTTAAVNAPALATAATVQAAVATAEREALSFFERAAFGNHPDAFYRLGCLLARGSPSSRRKSAASYDDARSNDARGDDASNSGSGKKGSSGKDDKVEAEKEEQAGLGNTGAGWRRDPSRAVSLLLQAAQQGHDRAVHKLVQLHAYGARGDSIPRSSSSDYGEDEGNDSESDDHHSDGDQLADPNKDGASNLPGSWSSTTRRQKNCEVSHTALWLSRKKTSAVAADALKQLDPNIVQSARLEADAHGDLFEALSGTGQGGGRGDRDSSAGIMGSPGTVHGRPKLRASYTSNNGGGGGDYRYHDKQKRSSHHRRKSSRNSSRDSSRDSSRGSSRDSSRDSSCEPGYRGERGERRRSSSREVREAHRREFRRSMSRDSSRSPSRESVGRDRGSISRRDSGNGGGGNAGGESESDRLLRQLKARLSESSMEFEDAGYGSGGSAGRSYHSRGSSMSSNASRRSHNEGRDGGEGRPRLVNFGAVSRTGHSSTRSSRDPSPMPNRRFACDDDDDDDNEHDDEDHSVLCFL